MNAPSESNRRGAHRYRMKQLIDATGLPRQAIHFYITEGLLPPGKKTGRNTALYTEEHLSRLLTIKKLQHEHFLPLKAIRAVLDGRESAFAPEQRQFLSEVRSKIDESLVQTGRSSGSVDLDEVAARCGVDEEDVSRAIEIGLIGVVVDDDGKRRLLESKVFLVELLGELRRLGFTRELGFGVDELAFYDDYVARLVRDEVDLLYRKLSALPPAATARLIESALPLVGTMLARQHEAKVRELFGALL